MPGGETIEITDCVLVRETNLAWGCHIDGDEDEIVWFPKSRCEYIEATETMECPEWLAIEKGLV
jgi:hypothetical protein